MKLIIVESPAKARTIEKFLDGDYKVIASYGHIRDLPSSASEIPKRIKNESWARLGVNPDDDFAPVYVVSKDSKKYVTEIKKLAKKADEILLATDEDREGEAISWHILEELDPKVPVKRIAFHEITKKAIQHALTDPRDVDDKLVRAQESRRILDRLFGYTLSPVLWKRVRTKLSAGRVQSAALRLVVEREEERLAFHTAEYWDIAATLAADGQEFEAKLTQVDGKRVAGTKDFDPDTGELKNAAKLAHLDSDSAQALAQGICTDPWRVSDVEQKETRKRPSPPFITSTLQQAASSRIGMAPRRTMQTAQRLYEGINLGGGIRTGLITYMRTDSLTLSGEALDSAAVMIKDTWGGAYTDGPRFYRTKAKSAQEAHEAIRPTNMRRTPDEVAPHLDKDELNLYRLIWQRTIASQMTDAILDRTTVDFAAKSGNAQCRFRATGSVVRFPGFLAATGGGQGETLLPDLSVDERIPFQPEASTDSKTVLRATEAIKHETAPPARFTEASLIKKLEEKGIGRPSTYAPTISTIQNREYVVKRAGALVPSYVGMAVLRLLRTYFEYYVDLGFTAKMEDQLDDIASGERDWVEFLHAFYHGEASENGLLRDVQDKQDEIEYPNIPVGFMEDGGEPLTVRIGRSHAYLQMGEGDDAQRVTLPVDLFIDELTPAKAAELFAARARANLPLGQDPETDQNIYIKTGPFGPYLQLGEVLEDGPKPKRVSLGRGTEPDKVDMEMALKLLSLPRVIGDDPETGKKVRAGLGRFGPYVERDKVYASIKSADMLFSITLEEALEAIRNKNKKPVLKEVGKHPETGAAIQVLKGRYGAYVTDGKVNATLRGMDEFDDLTVEESLRLMAEAALRKGKKKTAKKKTAKKKTTKKKATTKKKVAKKTTKKAAGKKTATDPSA